MLGDLRRFGGLRPSAWICIGTGYVREDFKTVLLKERIALGSSSVLNLASLCAKILFEAGQKPHEPLGSFARQEILRALLSDSRINQALPELKRLRRQSGFFKKLDRSVLSGRQAFVNEEEEQVLNDRLDERLGLNPVREEVRRIASAYGIWLEAYHCWDLPRILRASIQMIQENPERVRELLPPEISYLSAQEPEALEQIFWVELGRLVRVEQLRPITHETPKSPGGSGSGELDRGESLKASPAWSWQKWHTLDDAAEFLAERFSEGGPESWAKQAVLIPDLPAVRRSLRRALEARGIPLLDPRDPTRMRWDEGLKWALLPLDLVAKNFDRQKVISWLSPFAQASPELYSEWVHEIQARGIRSGLESYAAGKLDGVHERLTELKDLFGGRKTCEELAQNHLTYLRAALGASSPGSSAGGLGSGASTETFNVGQDQRQWVVQFFEKLWDDLAKDLGRVGLAARKAPLLFWMERLQTRLEEASPPGEFSKAKNGVALFRLTQAPLSPTPAIWLFGLPPHWLSGDGVGDYWFSEREREILASEFSVRSVQASRIERTQTLQAWIKQAEQVWVLDAHYEWEGRERESLLPLFWQLGWNLPDPETLEVAVTPVEMGAHPRWIPSYGAIRPVPALEFQLPSLFPLIAGKKIEIKATEMDRYSSCGFKALAGSRWKLKDEREPSSDPWPEVRGNILHEAVRVLLESRTEEGSFTVSPLEALEKGWVKHRPQGMLKGKRVEYFARAKLLPILMEFCEKEREYFKRSGTKIFSLEGPQLRLDFDDFSIVGVPDRIDEHPDGFFILDYKTSSVLPKGNEMVEKGYRMQLPFYALAGQKKFQKQALGVQFVELNRKGGRGNGIFFKAWNGKEPGKLTQSRSKLNIIDAEPAPTWEKLHDHLETQARSYLKGVFKVRPLNEQECRSCAFEDLCGRRRQGFQESDGTTEGGSNDSTE